MPPEHEVAGSNPAGRIRLPFSPNETEHSMNEPEEKPKSDRMPRGAVATVIVGLIVTLMVIAVDLRGGSSDSTEWPTVELVESQTAVELDRGGSFGLARTTISAIPPVESGELLFRIAGVVEIDSGNGVGPAAARCDVTSPAEGSIIARTATRVASWPRPGIDLQDQFVPVKPFIRFEHQGGEVLGVSVRDSFRIFTDSAAPTDVDWDGYADRTQNWVWTMPDGTGAGGATLSYVVIFKTTEKPRAKIVCTGSAGGDPARVKLEATQQEWPLLDPSVDTSGAESEVTTDTTTPVE